jgi:uncharacterized protein (DUF2267 family)
MDELIKLVTSKTGISEEQAKGAVQTVLGFLKEKLPAPIAAQVEGVINGTTSPNDLIQGLGGLFGHK